MTDDDADLAAISAAIDETMRKAIMMLFDATGRKAVCSNFIVLLGEDDSTRLMVDMPSALSPAVAIEMLETQAGDPCPDDPLMQALANLGGFAVDVASAHLEEARGKKTVGFVMVSEAVEGGLQGIWCGFPDHIEDDDRVVILHDVAGRLKTLVKEENRHAH